MKLLIRLLAVVLLGACAVLLVLAPARAGQSPLRVHLADSMPRSVLVDAGGSTNRHQKVHLALLASNAGSCPPTPTAAAQRISVRAGATGWQTTRRLSARNGGLSAALTNTPDLSSVKRVCGWLTAIPATAARVLASASDDNSRDWLAVARTGLIVALGLAVAAIALFVAAARISIRRDRARARKDAAFLAPQAPFVTDVPATPAPVAAAVMVPADDQAEATVQARRRPIAGHDGDVSWSGQPDQGPPLDPARLTTFEPNDPRLN